MARKSRFDLDADTFDNEPAPIAPRAVQAQAAPADDLAAEGIASSGNVAVGGIFGTGSPGSTAGEVMTPGWGGGVYQPVSQNDFIVGTEGADMIDAGAGDDLVYGAGGDDIILGGIGHDTLAGGDGHDYLSGGEGADWLLGGAGNDRLHGGDGNDRLDGGAGADELYGERGADVMTGGAGRDKFFVGQSWYASGEGRPVDTVTDFNAAHVGPHKDTIGLGYALIATDFYHANSTVEDAFAQGYVYLFQHGTQGQPGFGTSIWIDSNGGRAGGDFCCIADLAGVPLQLLNTPDHHAFSLF